MKVLVFESDQGFADELKSGLSDYGCETTVVDDGEAGIALASDDTPDLILLTIELPRMNGFSVCNKLKRNANLKKVPLVLLSSEATEETFDQHKRLRTRADEYVHKPVTVDELVAKLGGIVELKKQGGAEESVSDDVEDVEEIALDDDVEIEEVAVDEETEEAFGNLIAPAEAPAAGAVEMEELELEEGDGLRVAPEQPPATKDSRRPAPPAAPPPTSGPSQAEEALLSQVGSLKETVAQLEADLRSAREATAAEADAKAQVIEKKDAELALLEREIGDLRRKVETSEGAGTAREFLDLREQLNKKDKEILEIRDLLNSKEKDVIRLNDDNIALGRQNADLTDKVLGLERERDQLGREKNSALADKEQAQKRGDDYKAKSERLQHDLEARTTELRQAIESHENIMATRDAKEAAMRDDHATALRDAAARAEEAQRKAVAEAIQATEEKAAGEREAALIAAAEEANAARQAALSAREAELKAEQDSKLAALHRANEESLRKLRAEHDQTMEEARQAAAEHLEAREKELADERDAALAAQKADDDARLAEVEGRRAHVEQQLAERTAERDAYFATIGQRDRKIEELEAALATQRVEVVELGDKLEAESARLRQAREKWGADEAALRSVQESLEKVSSEITSALERRMP